MKRLLLLAAAGLALAAATTDPAWEKQLAAFRADREAGLQKPDGWLAVAGLFWLHEGDNAVGSDPLSDVVLPARLAKHAGVMTRHGETAEWKPASGAPASDRIVKLDEKSDPVMLGSVALALILRGGKVGLRLWDPEAETRTHFTGLKWYSPDAKWRIQARWMPYASAHTIPITNVVGMTSQEPAPGYAEFMAEGKSYRLEPIIDEGQLFFIFKDQTSTSTTYGAGRFLYTPQPTGATVELDFNKAYNPPCAFTAFATCPLPPRQNMLSVSIPAGEMRYGKH